MSTSKPNKISHNSRDAIKTDPPLPTPIIKWAGGKTKLLNDILKQKQPSITGNYFEPFFGSGALFFKVAPKRAVLSDFNSDLMDMYISVVNDVEKVIKYLCQHEKKHSTEYYYTIRDKWNKRHKNQSSIMRASMFIYLNKTGYNGLWRVNKQGKYNVPIGTQTNVNLFHPHKLRASAKLLKNAKILKSPYRETLTKAKKGDFVYLDPPYCPLSSTAKFTSYTAEGFNENDQKELALTAKDLKKRGCIVMISNHETPYVREIYKGFRFHRVSCTRSINSNPKKRGAVTELIITN